MTSPSLSILQIYTIDYSFRDSVILIDDGEKEAVVDVPLMFFLICVFLRCLQADSWRVVSASDDKTLKVNHNSSFPCIKIFSFQNMNVANFVSSFDQNAKYCAFDCLCLSLHFIAFPLLILIPIPY